MLAKVKRYGFVSFMPETKKNALTFNTAIFVSVFYCYLTNFSDFTPGRIPSKNCGQIPILK